MSELELGLDYGIWNMTTWIYLQKCRGTCVKVLGAQARIAREDAGRIQGDAHTLQDTANDAVGRLRQIRRQQQVVL